MLCLIGSATYQLIKTAAGELLLKKVKPVPGQIDLFSGEVYQPKKKLQPKGEQLELISLSTLQPTAKPKVDTKGRKRAPKGGGYFTNPATGESKFFAGGKFVPDEFSKPAENPTATPNLFESFGNTIEGEDVQEATQEDSIAEPEIPTVQIDTSAPMTMQDVIDVDKRRREGDITADELKQRWEQFRENKELIRAEVQKMTIGDLKKRFHSWHAKTKADWVDAAIDSLAMSFSNGGISYSPTFGGGREAYEKSKFDAIGRSVDTWTDEKIQSDAVALREHKEARLKALTNPETLEEYKVFLQYRSKDNLTAEQLRQYESLVAGDSKGSRQVEAVKKEEVKSVEVGANVLGEIQKVHHAKKNIDIFAVPIVERVERGKYEELKNRAKKYGGWYSSFRGNGAVPGFQFESQEAAERFRSLEAESGEERLEEKTKAKTEKVVNALSEAADRLEAKAQQSLQQSRLTNTHRRAQMAASAETDARADLQLSQTMRNLSEAQADGSLKFLDKVRNQSEINQLESTLSMAHWRRVQGMGKDWDKKDDVEIDGESIDKAEYPYPSIHKEHLQALLTAASKTPGLKLAANRISKQVKPSGHLAAFKTPQQIEDLRAIAKRFKGATDWKLSYPVDSVLRELADYDRMQRLDIKTPAELRTGLREYLQYRGEKKKADPIVALAREIALGKYGVDYFPTPRPIATDMANLADVRPGMKVLEPSAGTGYLADAAREMGGEVDTIEQSHKMVELLRMKGYTVDQGDFLEREPKAEYDRIMMNPPFGGGADMDHVRHAYEFLKPGGKLVAIVSEGVFGRSGSKEKSFRDWLDELGGDSEKMPEGSFLQSDVKTGVRTRMITIDKPDKLQKTPRFIYKFGDHPARYKFQDGALWLIRNPNSTSY